MNDIKRKINQTPYDENGRPHGEWIEYHDNNQIGYHVNYIHGVIHGLDEEYNKSGELMYRGYWNMDKQVGYWYLDKQKHYYLWLI